MLISITTSSIFLGFDPIIFFTEALVPEISILCFCAAIPIMVIIQDPRAAATKSVGEKASPLPLLSTGASVIIASPEDKCTASVLRLSLYTIFD